MDLLLILSQEHDKLPLAELRAVLEIEEKILMTMFLMITTESL